MTESIAIQQTENWIKTVVVGCNFCPFAAKALLQKSIRYKVLLGADLQLALETLAEEFIFLDKNEEFETTFIIFGNDFLDFENYLDLVDIAEQLNTAQGYDGIYQIASFHPDYCFEGAPAADAANFTNRSIYPMLHILRESSITKVLENYPHPEQIPQRNIDFAQEKGLQYLQLLKAACLK